MMKATLASMNINDLDKVLRREGIKCFKAEQLGLMTDPRWDGDSFSLPIKNVWSNIIPVLKLCDMIQMESVGGIRLAHCFSTPAYGKVIGEDKESLHKTFQAVDIVCSLTSHHLDIISAATKCTLKYQVQGYKVGIEIHDDHIHLDVGIENRLQLSNN